ncbi:FAD binding domain-containing protein [Colletotrichum chrysophilum]|uniref:FAD binding domain-containing protein n=1 Tax=Colletotrichum chrysophilum TaxID=1836956 RepID=A0AAD9AXP5_9PEZI|nr:FAD binding domain-containing protein [Colletotrichum chrysophilum]
MRRGRYLSRECLEKDDAHYRCSERQRVVDILQQDSACGFDLSDKLCVVTTYVSSRRADQVAPGVSILASDNVVRYDVVPGNGTMAVANASSNANPFWALKGDSIITITYNTATKSISVVLRGVDKGTESPRKTALPEVPGSIGHNTVKADVDEIYRIYEVWKAAAEDISDIQGLITLLF